MCFPIFDYVLRDFLIVASTFLVYSNYLCLFYFFLLKDL